ncbi:MAG: phosphogluconate dehydratase [Rhodobacterales bacterium]|jgi:phosphogluconate dehydratase|nr:phosphogluconate dehydratase [Rhodobacterales bacterium]MDB2651361.1 phosphogluconate dehydratase [Amylibacter sp.]MBT7559230.1 phosphogluconate dehydratase [Rhodobacterales bacterium]MDB4016487.1 phosphogluconate dehydratase [Amylibacter sp.]MDB4071173.1 phosphogluconate dehydratase [Amylibacter sp.]
MIINPTIKNVTDRITKRSETTRSDYLEKMNGARKEGPRRAHLTCGNQAHAYAPVPEDQKRLIDEAGGNIGIINAYNDMLSAHQPFEKYPEIIKKAARLVGGTAQVAAGVPAMCDGITQGQTGMELSLFSRDAIAMSAAIGLSHNVFDTTVYLGVCDKIVPGMIISAATFGHLPAVFLPAGPMSTGQSNDEKAKIRQDFAEGKANRSDLMASEMASYHGPGTCTFYGTANTNQMLMEFMGLHLPGSSFVNPNTPLRDALTDFGAKHALSISDLNSNYIPVSKILDEKAYVNGIVGLMATGGSTNLLIHLIAMARASGIIIDWSDFAEISKVIPLLAKVYPNGLADVNHFHAAGGLGLVITELLGANLLHSDTQTIMGTGLEAYTKEPKIINGELGWHSGVSSSLNSKIISTTSEPFQETGGLADLNGNLGSAVMKVSAVEKSRRKITAPVRVFNDQQSVIDAFRAGEFTNDVIIAVRYQGPRANGMPELHNLTPSMSVLQSRGLKVALITDGRMSGASGKVPAAIHMSPEALDEGPIAYLQNGDIVTVDAINGSINVENIKVFDRKVNHPDLSNNSFGVGRELFDIFRNNAGPAKAGASVFNF